MECRPLRSIVTYYSDIVTSTLEYPFILHSATILGSWHTPGVVFDGRGNRGVHLCVCLPRGWEGYSVVLSGVVLVDHLLHELQRAWSLEMPEQPQEKAEAPYVCVCVCVRASIHPVEYYAPIKRKY